MGTRAFPPSVLRAQPVAISRPFLGVWRQASWQGVTWERICVPGPNCPELWSVGALVGSAVSSSLASASGEGDGSGAAGKVAGCPHAPGLRCGLAGPAWPSTGPSPSRPSVP